MDLRCESKLLGVMIDGAPGGVVELKCNSRFCGAKTGVVVLHRFSTEDGKLLDTKRYRDTPRVDRRGRNGMGQRSSVRSA